jgi:predicted ATP-grasp superfamily ATP-dependent carboligase
VLQPGANDDEGFFKWLQECLHTHRVDVVLPIGDETTAVVSRLKPRLQEYVNMPVADWEQMRIASSKMETMRLAASIGMSIPRTYSPDEPVEAFPVVVKANTGSGRVRYVNSARELRNCGRDDVVVQEYVAGEGCAFFGLLDHGEPRAKFMHRRLREYPVTGGASTAAESLVDPILSELGLRILKALRWHGVAMVEFKRDRDGQYRLMEINPKFWGSLDLAITAGVEFPWLAVLMATGAPFASIEDYRVGARFRWVFDDLIHAVARPRDLGAFLRDFWDPMVADDLRFDDPGPSLFRAVTAGITIVGRMAQGTLRYPHGLPQAPVPE